MEKYEPSDSPANPFEGLDSQKVLDQVPAGLSSERSRSLWRRIDSELKSGGVVQWTHT